MERHKESNKSKTGQRGGGGGACATPIGRHSHKEEKKNLGGKVEVILHGKYC